MTPVKKTRRPTAHGPALLAVDVGNSETTSASSRTRTSSVVAAALDPRTPDETLLLCASCSAPGDRPRRAAVVCARSCAA